MMSRLRRPQPYVMQIYKYDIQLVLNLIGGKQSQEIDTYTRLHVLLI